MLRGTCRATKSGKEPRGGSPAHSFSLLESHFHVRSLERLMLKVVTEVLSPWGMKNVEGKSEKLYLSCSLSF